MVVSAFPPVEQADPSGLLAIGGDLELDSLLLAYSNGIFPWPVKKDYPLTWFAPPERPLLFVNEFRCPKRLQRYYNNTKFTLCFNRNFHKVIDQCAHIPRGKHSESWITAEMIEGYSGLYEAGFAYSVECYDGEQLVGGVYGVVIGGMVTAESMFYTKPNASKLCLVHLVEHLRERGVEWIDVQDIHPFSERLGVRTVPRDEFMKMLRGALEQNMRAFTGVQNVTRLVP